LAFLHWSESMVRGKEPTLLSDRRLSLPTGFCKGNLSRAFLLNSTSCLAPSAHYAAPPTPVKNLKWTYEACNMRRLANCGIWRVGRTIFCSGASVLADAGPGDLSPGMSLNLLHFPSSVSPD
jgi:hypothetical protein